MMHVVSALSRRQLVHRPPVFADALVRVHLLVSSVCVRICLCIASGMQYRAANNALSLQLSPFCYGPNDPRLLLVPTQIQSGARHPSLLLLLHLNFLPRVERRLRLLLLRALFFVFFLSPFSRSISQSLPLLQQSRIGFPFLDQ